MLARRSSGTVDAASTVSERTISLGTAVPQAGASDAMGGTTLLFVSQSSLQAPVWQSPLSSTREPQLLQPRQKSLTSMRRMREGTLAANGRSSPLQPLSPKQTHELRCLFTTGSQKSYLTERVMRLLRLKPTGEQTLVIVAFGATQCQLVSIGVHLKGYPNKLLSLHVVPDICEPLSYQPVTASMKSHDQLMSLDLADPVDADTRLPVDMLIGCDYYWELVTGSVHRME